MESPLKRTLKLKVKQPDVKGLKNMALKLKNIKRRSFTEKYGNILDLLEVTVQEGALTALAQFYDSTLRCFVFQDFHLAPTIEEFQQILGYTSERPYLFMGHYPSLPSVATFLNIDTRELIARKEKKGGFEGFSRTFLESHALRLAEIGDWDNFMNVLAFLIYGLIIFPNIENFVDYAAIDVLLAYKNEGRNPTTAVLADIYYALTSRYEKRRGTIVCCLPILYTWITSRMFKGKGVLEIKSNKDWAQDLVNLNEKTILWAMPGLERINPICRCGDFPNVPLMGTKGCINYNPILTLRQFCYPIKKQPSDKSLSPFIIHDQNSEMLHQIRRAWRCVFRKDNGLGAGYWIEEKSYNQWLKEKIQEIKLPFCPSTSTKTNELEDVSLQPEDTEKLIKELTKEKEENEKLKRELEEAQQRCLKIQEENTRWMEAANKANKKVKLEEQSKNRIKRCLDAANKELMIRGQERNEARTNATLLKRSCEEIKASEKSVIRQLEDLKQQLKKVVEEYEGRIQYEKQINEELESIHHWEMKEKEELASQVLSLSNAIDQCYQERELWARNFVDRASQVQQMINDASLHLQRAAEWITYPFHVPVEIVVCIESFENVISLVKNMSCNNEM